MKKIQRPKSGYRHTVLLSETTSAYLFVAPAVLVFVLLRIVPAIWALYTSFTDYSMIAEGTWVGVENYAKLLSSSTFWKALSNTLVYTLSLSVLGTLIALLFAMLLNQKIRGLAFFRTAFYAPVVVSWVAVCMIWQYILNPAFGFLNYFISLMGLESQGWLQNATLAMPVIIAISVWKCLGYNIVIYLSAFQGIPAYIDEAAMVDGAKGFFRFRRVTWQLLKPTTFFIFLITMLAGFEAFDQISLLTEGGPANATTTVVYEVYRNAFVYLKMGYACAMAIVLFIIILAVSMVMIRSQKSIVEY